MTNKQPNQARHPTAYRLRFGHKLPSLRLPAAGELGSFGGFTRKRYGKVTA